jgi:hypothetical protein
VNSSTIFLISFQLIFLRPVLLLSLKIKLSFLKSHVLNTQTPNGKQCTKQQKQKAGEGGGSYVNFVHNCQIHPSEAKIYGNTTKGTYTERIL